MTDRTISSLTTFLGTSKQREQGIKKHNYKVLTTHFLHWSLRIKIKVKQRKRLQHQLYKRAVSR